MRWHHAIILEKNNMVMMHSLLRRQLKRHFDDPASLPAEWQDFISAVNEAYEQSDTDRSMLERSLELSSNELQQTNELLKREITDRMRTGEALRKSEEKHRRIFEQYQDIYYETDLDGRIKIISPSVRSLLGFDPGELIGHSVLETYHNPEDRDALIEELRESGSVRSYELQLVKKDAKVTDVSINAHIVYGENEMPVSITGVIRDISDRKKAERLGEEEIKKRRNVIINTSHLLNTPLTIVRGNLEMLQLGISEMTPDLLALLLRNLDEINNLISGELYKNIDMMTVRTSDGFTPVNEP